MGDNSYNREILELVLTSPEISSVLKDYTVALVRAGFFDKERIFSTLGDDPEILSDLKEIYDHALKEIFPELKLNLDPKEENGLYKLNILNHKPKDKAIRCIKAIRGATGWDLKATKEFFDYIRPELINLEIKYDV